MKRRKTVSLKIIGRVRNNIQMEVSWQLWRTVVSDIIVDRKFSQDLIGIDLYRYIVVVFFMNRAGVRRSIGSLATCFPERPNPIGVTVVELLKKDGDVLVVQGLDAFDGTQVLDIKPYTPWSLLRLNKRIPDINLEKY